MILKEAMSDVRQSECAMQSGRSTRLMMKAIWFAGKLALLVAPVYSSQFTKIGRLVVNADILHPRLRNLPRAKIPPCATVG